MLYWMLKSVVLGPVLRLLFRPRVEGKKNVPATGPAILASNHLSFSDSIFLPLVLDRRITFPAKMEYFTGTGIKGWLVSGFMRSTGQIAIDRENKIVTTPCYMLNSRVDQVAEGADNLIRAMLEMMA